MIRFCTKLFFILSFIILIHYNSESQWNYAGNPIGGGYQRTLCFANIGANYFLGSNSAGVYISKDKAETWNQISESVPSKNIAAMITLSSYLIIGTQDGIYLTSDYGVSWLPVNDGLTNKNITCFAMMGSDLYVGTNGGIFKFNLQTISWSSITDALTFKAISSIAIVGNTIFAGTYGTGVIRTIDKGVTWEQVNNDLPGNSAVSITSSRENLYAGMLVDGYIEIYKSTNNGNSWGSAKNGIPQIQSLIFYSTNESVLAGTSHGLFVNSSGGNDWSDANDGLGTSRYIFSIGVMEGIAYTGLGDGTIRKRAANQIITSVDNSQSNQARVESRLQNFPNPCKDITTISFFHPSYEYVAVNLFDACGRKVKEVLANYLPPGEYSIEISLNSFTEGKYILQMNTASIVDTKLITLVK